MKTRVIFPIALLIAYGSLYPGDFSSPAPDALEKMLRDWRWFTSLSDVLGNIALFIPLGIAGAFFASNKRKPALGAAWFLIAALLFALVLQVAQVWLPSRSAALADVVWNLAGVALGLGAGRLLRKHVGEDLRLLSPARFMPYVILAAWLLAELLPLVPALDWQKFKDALKPLLLDFDFSFPAALLHAAGVLVAGSALNAVGRRPSTYLAAALLLILLGKLAIVTLSVDASLLLGLIAGYAACVLVVHFRSNRLLDAAFWILLAAWSVAAITPFSLASGGSLNLIPFATMLRGSMQTSAQALAQSIFIYGALIWLIHSMGGKIYGAALGLAIWASLLELTQMGLLGRNADVTEPLLVLLVAWAMATALAHARLATTATPTASVVSTVSTAPHGAREARFRWWWGVGLSVACLTLLMWAGLRLPGIPYNLRELFLGDGQFIFLLIFALALLWLGGGAVWVQYKVHCSRRPYLSLPLWAMAASMVSLLLLSISVTQESLDDIAGSNNLYWFVTNRMIWGETWRAIFMLLGPEVVGFFERIGRYAALYIPPLIFLILALSWRDRQAYAARTLRTSTLTLTSALLLLWLAKAVAFDWSSTDNLNELIAHDGPMGWGGGGYLYALLGLLCINAVMLGRVRRLGYALLFGVLSLALLPVGWWLLNLGLEANVEKYDLVFSGAQFLLGPDRAQALSTQDLFLRWGVVQIGFVAIVALGIRIALQAAWAGLLPASLQVRNTGDKVAT